MTTPNPTDRVLSQGAKDRIIDAVSRASDELLARWPRLTGFAPASATKTDGTPVSSADLASQTILVAAIASTQPGAVILAEEDTATQCRPGTNVWFVDPLDGTNLYLAGHSDFAVLVSGWVDDEPVLSVAAFPSESILAVADHEQATFTAPDSPPEQLAVHAVYCDLPNIREAIGGMHPYEIDRFESTRTLVDVARGHAAGAIVEMCGHATWDIAAPAHLISASRGVISDEFGNRIHPHGTTVDFGYLVAARSPTLHKRLLHVLAQTTSPEGTAL
ncbi:inositol monophosphatase family protein [Nocardia sp. NPDC060259]|uniref:inositol monophosphatase family protein n=1 Tax=Nocardia sp. NPDC060259 TaxID=3347088 RepID=UPI00364744B4